jgi:UDP-2,3-diacylglucosamine hydrolase
MKAIFFSDAHLLHNNPDRTRIVKRFIQEVSKDADIVFILGDLFEFYHGYKGYIYPFFREIVDVLRDVAARKRVYFIEGNHEFHMGKYFESYTGISCVQSLAVQLDEKKIFLSHGDEVSSLLMRKILKSRFIYSVMDFLGPDLTWKVAMKCRSFLSKKHKPYNKRVRDAFRRYGKSKLEEGYDAVIVAHSHMPDIREYEEDGKKKTYMNTGDIIASFSYGIYITGKGFTLKTYDRRVK